MNTGQMIMVLGALMLLSMLSLSVNSMFIDKTTTMLDAEANLNAISMAQSMIDEILVKSYDASTVSAKVYTSSSFNAPGAFGPNGTESSNVSQPDTSSPFKSVKYYNDVDDYHLYRRTVSNPRLGKFTIVDSVYYVQETSPNTVSSVATFHKKVVVTVTHRNMTSPLTMSDVAVYRRYF